MNLIRDAIIELMHGKKDISTALKVIGLDGGAGSGNFGHSGRPGKRGGSAKRGGGASKETAKSIKKERDGFKKLSREQKTEYLKNKGQIADSNSLFDEDTLKLYASKHGMSVDKYLDWRAARYFTMRKFQPEIEYKTPLKNKEVQGKYIPSDEKKAQYIAEHTGVSNEIARKMRASLKAHFGSSTADCEWTDKFIDSDSRYDGPIYRWKHYGGSKAKKIVEGLVPGAKIGNKHESNWSFSSNPWSTSHFGDYDGHYHDGQEDEVTIRYTCDKNITGSPVQCLSGFSDGECEVIPHSKTTWTISSVEKVQMPRGGWMYDVHMVEDDWHEEQNIPVWKPTGDEVSGGWVDSFPKNDGAADAILCEVRQECKKSGSDTEMRKFMKACPDGSTFYHLDNEKVMVLRKINNGCWECADITKAYEDHTNEWIAKLDNGGEFEEMGNEWSHYDEDLWNRCEKEGLNKGIVESKARDMLMNDDISIIQVGGEKKKSPNNKTIDEVDEDLKEMTKNKDYDDIPDYLDSLPTGFELYDKKNDYTLKKNEDGEWEYLDWDGEHVTDMSSNDVKGYFISKECDLGVKIDKEKQKIDKDFLDLKASGDIDKIREYLNNLPEGTILNVPDKGETLKKVMENGHPWWSNIDNNSSIGNIMFADHIMYDPTCVPELQKIGENKDIDGEFLELWNKSSEGSSEMSVESFKEHNTKEGIKSKLDDFNKSGDAEQCAKWLNDLPVGTVLGNDDMKVKYTYKGNGKWSADIIAVEDISSNSINVAKTVTKVGCDVKKLPVNIPKDSQKADAVLQEVKKNNREALTDFVENAPTGTTVMNVESGIVFRKDEYGGWEAVDSGIENYKPEKPWSSYKNVWTFNPGSQSMVHNIGLSGTCVIGMK